MVALTERMLNDAAGWQVTRHAKALVETRRVISANYTPPVLQGLVREGETEYRAGLKIISSSNMENLCSCRASRQWGQICAHSVAVGLQWLRPRQEPAPVSAPPVVQAPALPIVEGKPGDPGWFELHLVVGPTWAAMLEKNQLQVGFEAVRQNQRILISALKGPSRCSTQDLAILQTASQLADQSLPGMLILNREQWITLLNALPGFARLTVARREMMTIQQEPLHTTLVCADQADGSLEVCINVPPPDLLVTSIKGQWVCKAMTWQQILPLLPGGYEALLRGPVQIPAGAVNSFRALELPVLQALFGGADRPEQIAAEHLGTPTVEISLEGSFNHLEAIVQFIYNKQIVTAATYSERGSKEHYNTKEKATRHHAFEGRIIDAVSSDGFTGPDAGHRMILRGEDAILRFAAVGLPRWQKIYHVNIGPRFRTLLGRVETVRPVIEIKSSGENWFDLSVEMTSQAGGRFSALEIQRLVSMGRNYQKRPDGGIVLFDTGALHEFEEVLRDCDPRQKRPGFYQLDKVHAGYLDGMFQGHPGISVSGDAGWRQWTAGQLQPTVGRIPERLQGLLRPYQAEGVAWMQFLAVNRLGGILADEMGLGKTLQTLTFLAADGGRALVVCPSSLVFNWQREAARFVPELRVLVMDGPRREALFDRITESDLVVTSYALLRRDAVKYQSHDFRTLVLDEANHIKNPDTQNAQAALSLRVAHRFALTGTPVENSVRDVWSLAHFVLPGYLGTRDDFRERYELPIQRGEAPEILARLSKRLRPIMLRRLKRDVATDLPERIEQVAWCELTPAQKEVYRGLLEAGRQKIEEAAAEKNAGKGRMQALTALLRLRQACCDLRLCGLDAPPDVASAKLDMLDELLQEAMDGGHRVLIFSQFVAMLQLIAARLREAGIAFAYLDGSTRDRAAEVDRFQESATLPVFLISLKAGGTGLNLSAADTVIHFDPWWNPAVEAQATDRAHRIGQKRVVTSYKLITRDTVEEKILALQRRKRDVIDATVESEEPTFGALTMDEIRDLMN